MSLISRYKIGRYRRPVTELDFAQVTGPLLVVAPHPDDESLGAAGLMALMQRAGQDVRVVVISDGGASHPNSRRFTRAGLAEQRAREAQVALEALGIEGGHLDLWKIADGGVPGAGHPDFDRMVTRAAVMLAEIRPGTVVLPWRADPHPDHVATSEIWRSALDRWEGRRPRLLEYPVWFDLVPDLIERPSLNAFRVLQLDVWSVLSLKRRAIEAHESQTGLLIDDDPDAFRFDKAFRDRFESGQETFFEWLT